MAKRQPPAGSDTRDGAAGAGDQTSTTAAGGDTAERTDPGAGADGKTDAPQGTPGTDAPASETANASGLPPFATGGPVASAGGLPVIGERGPEPTPLPAPPAPPPASDPAEVIRAIAQDRVRESRARRYQDIPAEGRVIERHDLDALAVHLDLDPGTVIAARQYPDQLVYVTSDGRKVAKDMR